MISIRCRDRQKELKSIIEAILYTSLTCVIIKKYGASPKYGIIPSELNFIGYVFSTKNTQWTVHRELKKMKFKDQKNQSCREFHGDHFYILDIEFGRN